MALLLLLLLQLMVYTWFFTWWSLSLLPLQMSVEEKRASEMRRY